MALVIFIIGLPCSGKTTLAEKIAKETGCVLIDDPVAIEQIDGKITGAYPRSNPQELIWIEPNCNYIITDPWLVREQARGKARKLFQGFAIDEIYFENDVDKCIKNMHYRNKITGENRNINFKAFEYELPQGVETVKIWQNE